MKVFLRTIAAGIAAVSVFIISGCSSNFLGKGNSISPTVSSADVAPTGRDLTIRVKELDITGHEDQISNAQKVMVSQSFATSCATLKDLYRNCPEIVRCTVTKSAFTVHEGTPYTKIDVKVTDSLKGDLSAGDMITVMQMGGYMTLQDEVDAFHDEAHFKQMTKEERQKIFIEKKTSSDNYPKAGDSYVYYLAKDNIFPGAYTPVNDYECRFKIDGNGNCTRNMPGNEPNGTVKTAVTAETAKAQSLDHCTYGSMKEQLAAIALQNK
jgi:hypothetical protein